MASKINWRSDLDQAQNLARQENRPIRLDFFNPL